jgi:hypothetical protein
MQLEAIYDNGRLEFVPPIRLRHSRVRVIVQVPDTELMDSSAEYDKDAGDARQFVLPPEIQAIADEMQADLDRIRNAPIPPDAQLPPLTPKQRERMVAFELREDDTL